MSKFILMLPLFLAACSGGPIVAPEPEPAPAPVAEIETIVEATGEPALVDSLMGLSPGEVIARLGPPNLVRRDGLGQVMLFEHETCVFDVVFYAETIEAPYRVAHISSRTLLGQNIDKQLCLTALKPDGFEALAIREE